jgi:hypothetical protein
LNKDWYPSYGADEAHQIALSLHRYRLVIFSHVLTSDPIFEQFLPAIDSIFHDCSTGTVCLVLGALGKKFKPRRRALTRLGRIHGLKRIRLLEQEIETTDRIENEINAAQHRIFAHLDRLGGVDPASLKSKAFPDYHTPTPNPKKDTRFSMIVLRKSRRWNVRAQKEERYGKK